MPVIAGDRVLTTFGDHSVVAVELQTGAERAVFAADGLEPGALSAPVPAEGLVYVYARTGGPRMIGLG